METVKRYNLAGWLQTEEAFLSVRKIPFTSCQEALSPLILIFPRIQLPPLTDGDYSGNWAKFSLSALTFKMERNDIHIKGDWGA